MPVSSVLQSSRREALFTAAVWVGACVYTVGYCALFAYRGEAPPDLVAGIPTWVVYGIFLPWGAVTAITVWYATCSITDEELGDQEAVTHPEGEGSRG